MVNVSSVLRRAPWAPVLLMFASVPCNASLDLSFGGAKDSAVQGERIQLEWIVTNDGSATESNVSVAIPWPGGIASFSDGAAVEGGDCPSSTCDPGETVLWNIGDLGAGDSRTVFFQPVVANGAPGGPIVWTADLRQGGGTLESVDWTVRVASDAFAQLAADSDDSLALPGDVVRYRFTYGNTGTSPLDSSELDIEVPSGATIIAAPGGSIGGNSVNWNLGSLPPGDVGRRYIDVEISASVSPGDILELDEATLSGSYQGIPQSTSARHVVSIGSSPLSFSIKAQEGVARAGERFQMELVVSNTGSSVQQGVGVTMSYPRGVTSISESLTQGGDCPSSTCDPGEHVNWSFGNLLPGESRSVRFAPLQGGTALEGLPARWQARLASNSESSRRDYATLGVADVVPNLTIESSESKAAPGDVVTYVLNYGNDGSAPLGSAELSFPIPEGTTVVDAGGASVSGGVATWSLGDVGARAVLRRSIVVSVDGTLDDGRLVSADGVELSGTFFGVRESVTAEHTIVVGENPLQLSIRPQPATARRGEATQMEVVVSNRGGSVEQGVAVRLAYPAEMSSVSDGQTTEGGACPSSTCDPGEQIIWSVGNLLPGETRSYTFAPRVSSSARRGDIVYWQGAVGNSTNRERRADAIVAITDVSPTLAIWSDAHLVEAGDTYTYTFALGNRGAAALSQLALSVALPPELEFVSAPSASFSGGRIGWQVDSLVANGGPFFDGGVGVLSATVRARSDLVPGDQIELIAAELSGQSFGIVESAAARHVVTIGTSPLQLDLTLTPSFRETGESFEVDIVSTNTRSQVVQNVMLTLLYPFGVNSLSDGPLIDGGDCPSSTCDPAEHPIWMLGNLLPGSSGSATIDFDPFVASSAVPGTTLQWQARVQVNDGLQRRVEAGVAIGGEIVFDTTSSSPQCNGLAITVDIGAGDSPTSANDVILGTAGPDTINSGGGDDTVCAGDGDDIVRSATGDDWVDGGDGDDRITGGSGSDMLFGGSGNDRLSGGSEDDTIDGEEGDDFLIGGGGDDTVHGAGGDDTIFGQVGDDVLDGGDGVDGINGGGGRDEIFTGPGATVGTGVIVTGSVGNDTITGGPDADRLIGNNGADVIRGEGGDDFITGGIGRDDIFGGDGNDVIRGQDSRDTLDGGRGVDSINGGAGNDMVTGGPGSDTLFGSTEDDILDGEGGNDSIIGGPGDDVMVGGPGGGDNCNGGSGTDTADATCETVSAVP